MKFLLDILTEENTSVCVSDLPNQGPYNFARLSSHSFEYCPILRRSINLMLPISR